MMSQFYHLENLKISYSMNFIRWCQEFLLSLEEKLCFLHVFLHCDFQRGGRSWPFVEGFLAIVLISFLEVYEIKQESFLPCQTPTSTLYTILKVEGCRVKNGGHRIESESWVEISLHVKFHLPGLPLLCLQFKFRASQ